MGILFDENAIVPTKRIDIRRYEPQPFKERYLSNFLFFPLTTNRAISLDDLHETTSSSPQTEDLIKGKQSVGER